MLHSLFGTSGRMARKRYFFLSLLSFGIFFVLLTVTFMGAWGGPRSIGLGDVGLNLLGGGLLLIAPVCLWSCGALLAKRLHDMDHSALHIIWIAGLLAGGVYFAEGRVVPLVGSALNVAALAVFVWILLFPGTAAANRFGPVPD